MITNHTDIDVFIGIDVGKHNHHVVALTSDGTQILSKALPQNETKLRALIDKLKVNGTLLVIVDQPATIGRSPARSNRPSRRHRLGLPARSGDATNRRSTPRGSENGCQGRCHHRRSRPDHAPHAAGHPCR